MERIKRDAGRSIQCPAPRLPKKVVNRNGTKTKNEYLLSYTLFLVIYSSEHGKMVHGKMVHDKMGRGKPGRGSLFRQAKSFFPLP